MLTTLGDTGLVVSRIGLGLAALGRPGYINLGHAADLAGDTDEASMERAAHAVLDAAYAAGVRYFDAARTGVWTRRCTRSRTCRSRPFAVSRARAWDCSGRTSASTRSTQRRSTAACSTTPAVLEELGGLRASGLSIGLSVTGAGQAETIERALEVGGFDAVQATWNILERAAAPALEEAHAAGMGVIVKEALANGRLTARGGIPELAEAARAAGCTPDALALAAALVQPWADIVLSGAATVEALESNLAALVVEGAAEQLERLDPLREDPDAYWRTRATLPWN